ncbi:MAG: (Fe-S)-binding protein [candidate division WOR-3 bacterium]|nr:(Fe-S)-binding protein [candidate division WOR-3 bacterium]MCX7837089.1 (Fe-S)-binding protein [candidate division WOR-3 bacterium]MDW8114254.1 (Fe-S)-binding protein [candidate division WOR-3 bacterium]
MAVNIHACIQCSRCTSGCPVNRSNLNIRRLIYLQQLSLKELPEKDKEAIWECTTCQTCSLRCPKDCQPMDLVLSLRKEEVEKGRIEESIIQILESTYLFGNPWQRAREKRVDWNKELQVRIVKEGEAVENLIFICCTIHYDIRFLNLLRNFFSLLRKLDIDFGIIGEEESCCGSEIKRLGEEGLFFELREKNSEIINKIRKKRIITLSPHCYNALKKDYTLNTEIYHYTQFLYEIRGRISDLVKRENKKIIYHDPCFLGKQNRIFDEPREILKLITDNLIEFDQHRENSLCCEGGGGRMWIEKKGKERLAEKRVREAFFKEAEIIAVACPFCLLTLEDATKVLGIEEKIKVFDILEALSF